MSRKDRNIGKNGRDHIWPLGGHRGFYKENKQKMAVTTFGLGVVSEVFARKIRPFPGYPVAATNDKSVMNIHLTYGSEPPIKQNWEVQVKLFKR